MRGISVVLLLGTIVACAHVQGSSSPATPPAETRIVSAPPDWLWHALPAVYERLGLAVSSRDSPDRRPTSIEAVPGSAGDPYCVSTGRLEARIAAALEGADAPADSDG